MEKEEGEGRCGLIVARSTHNESFSFISKRRVVGFGGRLFLANIDVQRWVMCQQRRRQCRMVASAMADVPGNDLNERFVPFGALSSKFDEPALKVVVTLVSSDLFRWPNARGDTERTRRHRVPGNGSQLPSDARYRHVVLDDNRSVIQQHMAIRVEA